MATSKQRRNVQARADFQAAVAAAHQKKAPATTPAEWESTRPAKVYDLLAICKNKHWAEVDSEVTDHGVIMEFRFHYHGLRANRQPWLKGMKIPEEVNLDLPLFCTYEQYLEVADAVRVFVAFGEDFRRRRDQAKAAFDRLSDEDRDSMGISTNLDFFSGDNF